MLPMNKISLERYLKLLCCLSYYDVALLHSYLLTIKINYTQHFLTVVAAPLGSSQRDVEYHSRNGKALWYLDSKQTHISISQFLSWQVHAHALICEFSSLFL